MNVVVKFGIYVPLNPNEPFTIIFKYVLSNLQGFFSCIVYVLTSSDLVRPLTDTLSSIQFKTPRSQILILHLLSAKQPKLIRTIIKILKCVLHNMFLRLIQE